WYPGMEGGTALANIIFGKVNPSGKLPVTLPKTLSDYKVHKSNRTYPGNDDVYYEEGIFVGYRYFDKYNIEPLFPFGYGLSYTNFNYDNLEIDKQKITKKDSLLVSLNIKNEGDYYGGEIVQLYIQDKETSVERPIKELKGFKKIFLQPKEEKIVNFRINWKDLTYFDDNLKKWIVEDGEFIILIGTSSRDIKLRSKFEFKEK
ncbi:MAG: fibronectin type III-like domain-contianing protein, partial [Promethearchaeia archaeon]